MKNRKNMKKILAFLLALALAVSLAACGAPASQDASSGGDSSSASISDGASSSSADTQGADPQSAGSKDAGSPNAGGAVMTDPSSAQITVPESVETIVVLAPSIAETVVALGRGEQIVAYDTSSIGLAGLPEGVPTLDFMNPDMEQLAALKPDVLFVSGMTLYDQESPYQQLIDLGVCVVDIPTSDSLAGIESDIAFIAAVLGEEEKGGALVDEMQAEIDRVAAIGKTIADKKSVYFEISPAPGMYSFGSGVFLNELIELIGAQNILAEQPGWLAVEAEAVVAANPDVILTSVNFIENPTDEILAREGWESVAAVAEGQVFYIDNMASSLPNQNVVKAMNEMAKAIYPEYYNAE